MRIYSSTSKTLASVTIFQFIAAFQAFAGSTIDPRSIESSVKAKGAKAVYKELTRDPNAWNEVTRGISTADADWLAVYKLIQSQSDASYAETLQISLSKALSVNPALVLSEVLQGEKYASTSQICGRIDDDSEESQMLPFLKNQRAKVSAVKTKGLSKIKAKCLSDIDKAIKYQLSKNNH